MAKNSITDYSKTASLNTDIQSVDIDEGCLPSGINNAIRELMADLADMNDGTVTLTSPSFAAASLTGNLSFGDNNKAIFGAGNDLQIYHTGNDSVIADGGIGNLNILGDADVAIINAASTEYKARFITDGAVELYYNGTQKLATTTTGIDVTGNASFDDNGKAIFGAGSDLQIYHDGSNSYIWDAGTGLLQLRTNGSRIEMVGQNGSEYMARFEQDGAVKLYYDNAQKLATTSTGIDVTGTVTADGLTVDTDTLHVDSTNNRVGIGTNSPTQKLTVANGYGIFEGIKVGQNGTDIDSTFLGANSLLAFKLNGTERMRIDSSGNVLVGQTSANSNVVGIGALSYGSLYSTRDGGSSLLLNRKTSDGDIAVFQKDGTTVGRVGAFSNSTSYCGASSGIYFNGANINPTTGDPTVRTDNANDIGQASQRFKDLYLGGGVYLGGTGAANHLDDYEEGTWTPSYTTQSGSFSSITYNEQNGTYVKIGRLVVVSFDLRTNSVSLGTASGSLYITGLPFNINGSQGTAQCGAQQGWVTNAPEYLNIADGSNYGFLRRTNGAGYSDITVSNLTTGSSTGANRILGCSLAYYTNS